MSACLFHAYSQPIIQTEEKPSGASSLAQESSSWRFRGWHKPLRERVRFSSKFISTQSSHPTDLSPSPSSGEVASAPPKPPRRELSPTASGCPNLTCSQCWGGEQEREETSGQAVRKGVLHLNKPFHPEAD